MLPTELDIVHQGALRAAPLLWRGSDGRVRLSLAVSERFDLHHGAEATLALEQDEPDQIALDKPGVDVVVMGDAYAPGGAPVLQLEVAIAVGPIHKGLTVIGQRHWLETPRGVVVGAPTPFQQLPLSYDRGVRSMLNPAGLDFEPRIGHPLPCITVLGPGAAAMAPGFGPLSAQLRGIMAGLSAQQAGWLEQGLARGEPMPEGLDISYFHVAPPEQRLETLRGEIDIQLSHLHPSHPQLQCRLRIPELVALILERGAQRSIALRCDTLWIDAARAQAKLTWRGVEVIDDPDVLAHTPILVGQEVLTTEHNVERTLALESTRELTNTILADFSPGALGGRSMPFILGTSAVQTSDGTNNEEGPPTARNPEDVDSAVDSAVDSSPPTAPDPPWRERRQTDLIDPDVPAAKISSPYKLASGRQPMVHTGNAIASAVEPASSRDTAEILISPEVISAAEAAPITATVRDTAEIPTALDADAALPFVAGVEAASSPDTSPEGPPDIAPAAAAVLPFVPAGELRPAPLAGSPFSPVSATKPPTPADSPPPGLLHARALSPLTPQSPETAPPRRIARRSELPFAQAPPRVRPPDPLGPSARTGEPARLDLAVPKPAPVPVAPVAPTAPERLGPLAGRLDEPPADESSEVPDDSGPPTRPSEAPEPLAGVRPSQVGLAEPIIALEVLAAVEAALHLAAEPERHAAVLERFELSQAELDRARTHHKDQQAHDLNRGKRALLDAFDDAYVAQLERERGAITVEDYAQLELAVERNNLAEVLPELGLVRPVVLPIKRVWMRKIIADPALAKSARQALSEAREA